VKIKFSYLSCLAIIAFGLVSFSGCTESTILGSDLIPGTDKVNVRDTTITNLIVNNVLRTDSTVFTGGPSNVNIVIGSITDDNVFGKSHGIAYAQFDLPSDTFRFKGSGVTIDSAILYIPYSGFYGDSMANLSFKVVQMNEPTFKADSSYRYFHQLGINNSVVWGNTTVNALQCRDSAFIYGTSTMGPSLKIPLNNTFKQLFLSQSNNGAAEFDTDSTFRLWMNGLALVPDTAVNGRTLLYLSMSGAKISFQYKNSEEDSLVAHFGFSIYDCGHQNFFARNYSGSQAANYINTGKASGDSLIFLQEAPGIYANLQIPGLENFPANAAINQAELVINQASINMDPNANIYTAPDNLMLYKYANQAMDSLGYVVDYGNPSSPNTSFGGQKTVISNVGGVEIVQYKFNIARYMQLLLKGSETNYGFRLVASSPYEVDSRRVVVGGSGEQNNTSMHVRIIYTKQ